MGHLIGVHARHGIQCGLGIDDDDGFGSCYLGIQGLFRECTVSTEDENDFVLDLGVVAGGDGFTKLGMIREVFQESIDS